MYVESARVDYEYWYMLAFTLREVPFNFPQYLVGDVVRILVWHSRALRNHNSNNLGTASS